MMSLKRNLNGKIKYGQQQYDFGEGMMFFISPVRCLALKLILMPHRINQDGCWSFILGSAIGFITCISNNKYDKPFYRQNSFLFCMDKGLRNYKRCVGLSVLAYNLHILGNALKAKKQAEESKREKQLIINVFPGAPISPAPSYSPPQID